MAVEFACPFCGQALTVPEEAAGQIGNCYSCGAELRAPAGPDQPAFLLTSGRTAPPEGRLIEPVAGDADPGAVVSESWKYLTRNWWAVLLSALITSVLMILWLLPVLVPMLMKLMPVFSNDAAMNRILDRWSPVMVLWALLMWPLTIGPLYVAWRAVARDEIDIGSMFSGFRRYKDFLIAGIVYTAPSFLLTEVPGFFLAGSKTWELASYPLMVVSYLILVPLSLGRMEMIDKGVRPREAFRRSIEAVRGNYLGVLLSWILLTVIGVAGLVVCCVGVFFTLPIMFIGEVILYKRLRGLAGPRNG